MASRIVSWTLMFGLVLAVRASMITQPRIPTAVPLNPTILNDETFNITEAAVFLVNLLDDTQNYIDTALEIFTQRTARQREDIFFEINRLYGNAVLFSSLLPFVFDDFGIAMGAVLSSASILFSTELNEALIDADEDTILEILLSMNKSARDETFQEYEDHYLSTFLEDFNRVNFSQYYKDIIDILCTDVKNEALIVDKDRSRSTAGVLAMLLEGFEPVDFGILNFILLVSSDAQLRAINHEYIERTGHTIRAAVNKKLYGPERDAYDAIVRYRVDPHRYLAERLNEAMFAYVEPDLTTINRIIIGRSEIDLGDIVLYYRHRYSRYLTDDLMKVTSGEHLDLLLLFFGDYIWL